MHASFGPGTGGCVNKQSPHSEFGVSRRQLVTALRKLRRGDFTVRLNEEGTDEDSEIAILFNEVVGLNEQIMNEFDRLSRVVGKEGKIDHRAKVRGATGGWDEGHTFLQAPYRGDPRNKVNRVNFGLHPLACRQSNLTLDHPHDRDMCE